MNIPIHPSYLPEGLGTPSPGREALLAAAGSGAIFHAAAVKWEDECRLLVDVGDGLGVIPWAECILGADSGTVRDIAVISRVGKAVCFTVVGEGEDGRPILSRRAAQHRAWSEYLVGLTPGDIIPARVTRLEGFGAFVDVGCGVISFIGIENISVSRIPHPGARFEVGQSIPAAVLAIDRAARRITLTHRELLGTWLQNAQGLGPGDVLPGIIRGVEPYGLFIELTPNLSGLAEPRAGFVVGDRVSVLIKSLSPRSMKVKLAILEGLEPAAPRLIKRHDYYIESGHLKHWQYSPPESERHIARNFGG